MPLTDAEQAKVTQYLEKFAAVWEVAGNGLDFCRKLQGWADSTDLNITAAQKVNLLMRVRAIIDQVAAANAALQAIR